MTDRKDRLVDEKPMRKMSVAPPDADDDDATETGSETGKDGKKADPEREQEELEEGLEESFPASDPPANIQPGHGREKPEKGS